MTFYPESDGIFSHPNGPAAIVGYAGYSNALGGLCDIFSATALKDMVTFTVTPGSTVVVHSLRAGSAHVYTDLGLTDLGPIAATGGSGAGTPAQSDTIYIPGTSDGTVWLGTFADNPASFAFDGVDITDPAARVSQFGLETLVSTDPAMRASQFGVEALVGPTSQSSWVSQFGLEALVTTDPAMHASQFGLEVLVPYTAGPVSITIEPISGEAEIPVPSYTGGPVVVSLAPISGELRLPPESMAPPSTRGSFAVIIL